MLVLECIKARIRDLQQQAENEAFIRKRPFLFKKQLGPFFILIKQVSPT
ncbi:hypothetical protein ACTHQ4_18465 [Alkalicoccobacillus gibsonii]